MIRIGPLQLETAVPADLDARLAAMTGCSAAEVKRMLAGPCIAGFIAKALTPLLADPLARHELTAAIVAVGRDRVRKRVRALLSAAIKQQGGSGHGPTDER
jgi:hypothetical protein